MTSYAERKERGCAYAGCPVPAEHLDGHNLCERHAVEHRERNRKHMQWRRLAKRVQLGLGL